MGGLGRASRHAVLALVAGALAAVGLAAPGSVGRYPAPAASSSPAASRSAPQLAGASASDGRDAVLRVYHRRSLALATGDRSAWESTVADPTSEAGRQQLLQYDNLRALGITELTVGDVASAAQPERFPAGDAPPSTGGSPSPKSSGPASAASFLVRLGHRIPGFDRAPRFAARTVTLGLSRDGEGIAQDHSTADQPQAWDLAGLRVQRSATALVAGNVDADVLAHRLVDAEAGQARVRHVLGASVPAVLVVPRTAQEAARQLGRETLGQVAASTDGSTAPASTAGSGGSAGTLGSSGSAGTFGSGGSAGGAAADRVVLNPDAFAGLTDQGRQVVVAHELAHVAMRASLPGRVPLWLSEGLAEYVAWEPVTMPVQTAAASLLARVQSVGAPATLPVDGDFDPGRADVATAYQGARLAVGQLMQTHGDEALLAFYRAVAGTSGAAPMEQAVARAFVSELGTTVERFEQEWRARLVQLAK